MPSSKSSGTFERLAPSVSDFPDLLETLEVAIAGSTHQPPSDLVGTANALAELSSAPVVRLGVDRFERLVDSLWRHLWPALRRTFAFRLSFGPKDVVEQPAPALVCTPEQLQARWTTHRIVNPEDRDSQSESAGILCGQRDVRPVLDLAKELGLEVDTIKGLAKLERLHTLSRGKSFDDLLAAIRLADGLSNQPVLGTSLKTDLVDRFADLIPGAGCKQLLLMRNLALSGFSDTQSLWSAVECLVGNLEFSSAEDRELMEMIAASIDQDIAVLPWRVAVTNGLSVAARRDNSSIFQAIWRWTGNSQAAFAAAMQVLPDERAVELRLAKQVPKRLDVATPAVLLSSLLKKRWLIAHGAVLASTRSPVDALEQQLKVDRDPKHSQGLRSALRYASPLQVLECTKVHKDIRLVELCADTAVEQPHILLNICGDDIIEQQLWCAAIEKDGSLWNAPSNALDVRNTILSQLLKQGPVDLHLLEVLAHTPLANLIEAPERARLWSLLPGARKNQYLQATASGWLDAVAMGATIIPPEIELEHAILSSPNLRAVLDSASTSMERRLSVVSALPLLHEEVFIAWLNKILMNARHLSAIEAEQLGMLVASRRWERTAKYLADLLAEHRRQDLMPGLRRCSGLLGFYTLWKLEITKPTAFEKWREFEKEVCLLYPNGPDSNELWSRAGEEFQSARTI